jgi:hypothetical protein
VLERAEFKETLGQMELTMDHVKHWGERLRDHQSLVSGMSRLPL